MKIKNLAALLLTLFAYFLPLKADENELRWFKDNWAWLDLRCKFYTPNKNALLERMTFGTFSMGVDFGVIATSSWETRLYFEIEGLSGGFHDNRVKIYRMAFPIELKYRAWLNPSRLYISISSIHLSTHPADQLPIENLNDAQDFQNLTIEADDLNIIRFGLGRETPDDHWIIGAQPWRMNYFMLFEPNKMFGRNSYGSYDRRAYFYGARTIWKGINTRLSATLETEGEINVRTPYIVTLVYSWDLGRTISRDRLQTSLSYEGGLRENEILARSFHGLAINRWVAGFKILIGVED